MISVIVEIYRNWKYNTVTVQDEINHYLQTTNIMNVRLIYTINDEKVGMFEVYVEPYYNFYNKSKLFPSTCSISIEQAKLLLPRCSTKQAKNELTRFILEQS
jgi:hypothetical protein